MKTSKRFLALLLAFLMMFGNLGTVVASAAEAVGSGEEIVEQAAGGVA